jgi:membrane protease YdiL (CAAX protease family)
LVALYDRMTLTMAVPFILFIAVAPGFCEELLFRGYMQRRLLERWPAWLALLVVSVLFGVMHGTPVAIAAAYPIGVWLGVLAWRTGSVWPGVACHAFVNGSWNVYQIGARLGYFTDDPPVWVIVILVAVAVPSFLASVWLVWRPRKQTGDEPAAA